MARSTNPAIAALTDAELVSRGCCAGLEEASEWSGLSANALYDLMNSGELPWRRRGQARLIPRRALEIILEGVFAGPEQEKQPRPGAARPA